MSKGRSVTSKDIEARGGRGVVRRVAAVTLSAMMCLPAYVVPARELGDLSLEELLNESVTSVSKREQKLGDVAAAITVLSNDDLRRSGVTTIADALRLVPGMSVGSVNASQWAVSARGFNNLYANKLLVLIDGRTVYTPLFAGVYWDLHQPMLEDVDRIEVIRGPGATVWGANAVNGVINVATRSARDTQGTFIYGGGGWELEGLGGARHGGRIGENTYYRAFASVEANDGFTLANGQPAGDDWHRWVGGFRLDHYTNESTHLTWQADIATTTLDNGASDARNINTLGRWTRELGERSSLEAQFYFDRVDRHEVARVASRLNTLDFELQHTIGLGDRHDVIWGAGYRSIDLRLRETTPLLVVSNDHVKLNLFSAFVQDEFRIVPNKFAVTAGFKVEHNDFTGFEVQPSVRAVFKPSESQTWWGAVSRAVRTPSALEGKDVFGGAFQPPIVGPDGGLYLIGVRGNANPESEVLWAHEVGWRIQPARNVSVDLALFYNRYSGLIELGGVARFVPGEPFGVAEMPFQNLSSTNTYGGEITLQVSPTSHWKLSASHSVLIEDGGNGQPSGPYDPKHQTVLRSSHDLGAKFTTDVQLRRVGAFEARSSFLWEPIPAYTAVDLRLTYRPAASLEIAVVGQNLLDDQHREQGMTIYAINSEVPRRLFGKITWRF